MNKDCGCGSHSRSAVHFSIPSTTSSLSCKDCVHTDSSCVNYTGVPLEVSSIGTNVSLERILQEFDAVISDGFDTSWNYNYKCLSETSVINSRKTFVGAVVDNICRLKEGYVQIESLPEYKIEVDTRIDKIENPRLVSNEFVGIEAGDPYRTVLGKLSGSIYSVYEYADISGVNWSANYTVTSVPVNVQQGFNEVIRQIGLVKSSIPSSSAITLDTTGTCLPTQGSTTPIKTVVEELVLRVCDLPEFNSAQVEWGCVSAPVDETLQGNFNQVVNVLSSLVEEKSVFDQSQFDITPLQNCAGYSIKIKDEILEGTGMVNVTSNSTAPQYLSSAIEAGTNITTEVTPQGKLKINATVPDTNKVSVQVGGTAKYLVDAIEGSASSGSEISLTPSVSSSGNVVMGVDINEQALADLILTTIRDNPALMTKLCNMLCSCQDCN